MMNLGENPDLKEEIEVTNELKEYVVQYVGNKMQPENGNVDVEMVVEAFAEDFPEFLMAVAEENWIRGYHQALEDIEVGQQMINEDKESETTDG
jgi:hypothetical protein|tara:strand:- start:253 stop:534 length:282 start_codon:yes stop_codon:yes gene_type:complete